MARRRSQVADFLTAFNQAYRMTDQVAQDFEIGRIARAKPEEMQGFSQDQAEQLRTAAESGQYDIGVKYKDDGTFESYTVTPKADGSHTGTIGMQRMTDFLGKRTPGALTDDQVEGMRQKAMAGVVTRSDPVRGMQMMRDITRDERDAKRFEFETHRNDRQVRLDQEADTEKALVKQVDADVADHFRKMLTNPDGTQRAATTDDHLVASQYRASRLLDAGKVDAAGQVIKDFNAQSLVKIQLESAQRNEALGKTAAALAAGDLNAVRDFYNQYIPDGARVVDVSQDRDGRIVIQRESLDGRPLPATTLKDTGQMLAALSTFKDPMALYSWSQNEFKNNLQLRADARAERADGRAASAAARAAEDAELKRSQEQRKGNVRTQLMQERNPNATPAELEAAQLGVIDPVQRVDDKAPAEVKLARALVDAGIAPDMKEGLQQALQTKGKSAEQVRAEIYGKALTASMGDSEMARKATDDAMRYLYSGSSSTGATASVARQSGEERIVQSGPHKGKTAVWDGQGWVLKQ
jgi:hypothetical protein